MSDKPLRVTVATLNILNDASSWPARRQLIALQEVALPANNAQWLADELGGYTVHLCPKTGRKSEHEALGTWLGWVVDRFPRITPGERQHATTFASSRGNATCPNRRNGL